MQFELYTFPAIDDRGECRVALPAATEMRTADVLQALDDMGYPHDGTVPEHTTEGMEMPRLIL